MKPIDASKKKNEGVVYLNLLRGEKNVRMESKFKIGDKVRISKYKRKLFDKGYTSNWSEEVFIISKINPTNPVTYQLKDVNNKEIKGSFYELELQKAKQEVFRIEKVIKRDYKKSSGFMVWLSKRI